MDLVKDPVWVDTSWHDVIFFMKTLIHHIAWLFICKFFFCVVSYLLEKKADSVDFRFISIRCLLSVMHKFCFFSAYHHLFILFLSFCRMANPDKQTLRGSRLSCVKTVWSNRPKEPFSLSLAVLPCSIDQLSQVCAKITEPIDMRNPSRSWGGIQSPSLNEEVCVHHSLPLIWEP